MGTGYGKGCIYNVGAVIKNAIDIKFAFNPDKVISIVYPELYL